VPIKPQTLKHGVGLWGNWRRGPPVGGSFVAGPGLGGGGGGGGGGGDGDGGGDGGGFGMNRCSPVQPRHRTARRR
jgi:hypothetical protein